MKIHGYFDESGKARVQAQVVCQALSIRDNVAFVLDTGASRTVISDSDALKLGIDYTQLQKLERGMFGFGGQVDTYIIYNAELLFSSNYGVHVEPLRYLFVAKHQPADTATQKRIRRLPSVIGCDILDKYAFVRDKQRGIIVITDAELEI